MIAFRGFPGLRPAVGTPVRIGRGLDNDIRLTGPSVSFRHASVCLENGSVVARDLGSRNGTWVNGVRVTEARLLPGDVIEIGSTLLEVLPDSPAPEDEVTELLAQAVLEEGAGQWEHARELYRRAAERRPFDARIAVALRLVADKERIYRTVEPLLWERARRKTQVLLEAADVTEVANGPFRIRLHGQRAAQMLPDVVRALREARVRLKRHLGVAPDPVLVEVHSRRTMYLDDAEVAGGRRPRESSTGLYDGEIRISLDPRSLPGTPFLFVTLIHEYAHLVVDRVSGGRCPRWLDEGIALLESQELPVESRVLLRNHADSDSLLPFELLERDFELLGQSGLVALAYAQAHAAAAALVARHGWRGVKAMLANAKTLAKGRPADSLIPGGYAWLEGAVRQGLEPGNRR